MTGEGTFLAFLFLLELAVGAPSCCFINGNERQAWVDLWLLLSRGGGNHDMGALEKEASLLVDLQKAVVVSYAKLLWLMPKALLLKTRHWTYHRVHCGSSTKAQDWPTPNIPTIPTQVTLIVQGSMPLMTMSTTVMTVLHSVEVVHIPHGPRLSLVAKHPLIWRNTLTHIWGVR
jgi:hypothetical protein